MSEQPQPQPKQIPAYLQGSKAMGLFLSPNQAIAGGLHELSHEGKRLGVFKDFEELDKPRVMYSLSTNLDGSVDDDFAWLEKEGDRYLALSVSTKNGLGLKYLVEVLKATVSGNKEEQGLTDRIRNFISSRTGGGT
ncbi:MAG: hypothetical protein NWF01_08775 [Candidatus Bathyarchaeota archaeon]|nr:hypothetical protein [Candidatus Bathyarchaeota archaeon]